VAIFQWAVPDHVDTDPTAGFRVKMPKTAGHLTWTVEMIERYHERHPLGTKARLAMDLALYTGLRRSDICRIGPQHISNGVMTIRAKKGGEIVEIVLPVLEPLRQSIAASKVGNLAFVVTEYGKPFTVAGFGNWFADRCNEAKVDGRAHGLRKAAATFAADNGATTHELNAIFGWSGLQQAELYTRAANRRKAALAKTHLMMPDHMRNTNTRTHDDGTGNSAESAKKSTA
jgi:integrase